MALSTRLLRLIEEHSDELGRGLQEKFQASPRLVELRARVPEEELRDRTTEIYRNLQDWLSSTAENEIERVYSELGARRAGQGVPFSQLLWALHLTRQNIISFLEREGFLERPLAMVEQIEVMRLLDQFFGRASYHLARGYERIRATHAA